jgi:hypothetical protein
MMQATHLVLFLLTPHLLKDPTVDKLYVDCEIGSAILHTSVPVL